MWKNGHWIYYYDDGTATKDYPKGQNYKTIDQVKAEKDLARQQLLDKQKESKTKQERINEYSKSIDSFIQRGKDKIEEINFYMKIPVAQLIKRNKK